MFELCCDDPLIERELKTLSRLMQEAGGWLHPQLRVYQKGHELSLGSTLAPESRDVLICLPEACLPVIARFELAVENDDFVVVSHEAGLDTLQVRILEKTLDVYNLTRKAEWHRRTSLWFTLSAHPELVAALAEARRGNQKVEKSHRLLRSRDVQGLLLHSFLGTRTGQGLRKEGGESGDAAPQSVLMPMVDFVNHSWRSPTFQNIDPENKPASRIAVVNSKPVPGSDECYVLYNLLDALDAYTMYDFVEEEAPFVRSVPVRTRFFNGAEIEALGSRGELADKAAMPAPVRDLWMYMPSLLEHSEKYVQVSSFLIPGEAAPFALRRVLALFIQQMTPGLRPRKLQDLVLETEHTVIATNLGFYEGLESSIRTLEESGNPVQDDSKLRRVIDVQLSKLKQYADRLQLAI